MVCGGVNPPYAQIMMLLWLPGPSFCWQGPWCRSIFDLTSTANHRDQAQCQEEVGLFAYWAGASEVGGKTAWQRGTVEKKRSNAYRQTNLEECRQTNKQERMRERTGRVSGVIKSQQWGGDDQKRSFEESEAPGKPWQYPERSVRHCFNRPCMSGRICVLKKRDCGFLYCCAVGSSTFHLLWCENRNLFK